MEQLILKACRLIETNIILCSSFGVNATEEDGDHPLLTGLYWSYSDARLVVSLLWI